jgi:hypothetical protein
MTRMSCPHRFSPPEINVNRVDLQRGSALAHPVHRSWSVPAGLLSFAVFTATSGCVIPPSLSLDNQDAGQNSPPAITRVSADGGGLRDGEPALFTQGEGSLSLDIVDTDVGDTLQVRIFVDYTVDNPQAPRVTHTIAPNMQALRSVSFGLGALCTENDLDKTRNMTLMVFDRIPVETDEMPIYQKMPDGSGGLSTSHFYFLKCSKPPTI